MLQKFCISVIFALFCLAGCSPKEQAFKPETRQPEIKNQQFYTVDDVVLPLRLWTPASDKPEAVVVALHGFNDYSNAFNGVGQALAEHNIAVYAYDQRGFGRTEQIGIWAGQENLTRDLKAALAAAAQRYPDVPLYAMGESMGGAVVMLTAASGEIEQLDGVILIAPAVWGGGNMGWFYRLPLWFGVHLFPSMEFSGKNLNIWPSDNLEMLRALSRDPLIIKKTRMDAIYGIVNLMDNAYDAASQIHLPVLYLYGAHDEIIPRQPSYETMLNIRPQKAQRVAYYEQGFHMLTRDLQAERVHRDIAVWIKDRQQPLPSGADREVASRLTKDIVTRKQRPKTGPWAKH